MQEQKIWEMLLKHLSEKDSNDEKKIFSEWLNKNEENKALFYKVKTVWDSENNVDSSLKENTYPTFFGRFTKQKMKNFIFNQSIGNLIGFTVGMWVTAMFSHSSLEKRGLKNFFGLAGRKKVVVNEIPEWLQNCIAILIGFIVLELINHFFQSKKHLIVWLYIKKTYIKLKSNTKNSRT